VVQKAFAPGLVVACQGSPNGANVVAMSSAPQAKNGNAALPVQAPDLLPGHGKHGAQGVGVYQLGFVFGDC
jgi:hypothetical protein